MCLLHLKEDKEKEHLFCQTSQNRKFMQKSRLSEKADRLDQIFVRI